MKISTGIKEVDLVLDGGYLHPGTVLLEGQASNEKLALLFHFAVDGLKRGDSVYYLTTDMLPSEIISKASNFAFDLNGVVFLDCYSYQLSAQTQQKNVVQISGPTALNDISLIINDILKKRTPMRFIVNSLSTLAVYNPQDSFIKFLQVACGKLKSGNATILMTIDEAMHEKKFLMTIEHLADIIMTITSKESTFEISSPSLPLSVECSLTPAGIMVL